MCVLHITSKTSSFEIFIKNSQMPIYKSHEKGDISKYRKNIKFENYNLSCNVSKKEFDNLVGQFDDAIYFLTKYKKELFDLNENYSIDDMRLDFPYECRLNENIFMQSDYLPPELIYLSGQLGIGIELSHYAVSEDDNNEKD